SRRDPIQGRAMGSACRGARSAWLGAGPLATLELQHQAPEEVVELLLLAVVEGGRDELLLLRLYADGPLVRLAALLGHLHEDAASVVRVRSAADKPRLLEAVDAVRHRPARELHVLAELAGCAAEGLSRLGKAAEHLVLARVETELRQRLVQRPEETATQAADAVDDPFDFEIEIRKD